MDDYTVTFVYDGDFDLPNDPDDCAEKVPGMVLEKLKEGAFELVDFNLSDNYNQEVAGHYIEDPRKHRSVVEMIIGLGAEVMQSRKAIYQRCTDALQDGELQLGCAYENDNQKLGMLQSIIKFVNDSRKVHCIVNKPKA